MTGRLEGVVALVTGAAGGLGAGMTRAFVEEGASVVMGARVKRNADTLNELVSELGPKRVAVADLDVSSEDSWAEAVATAEVSFGTVTVLVNNAARAIPGTVESYTLAQFREVLDTNLIGTFLGMKAVIPGMRAAGGGSIVNVNSTAGLGVPVGLAGYGTSKWAMRGLTKIAAKELARDNIRVNGFHAGIIETPLAYHPETGIPLVDVSVFAMPRRASVAEMSRYMVFAVAEGCAFSTGTELVADGGALLGVLPRVDIES